MKIYLNKSAFDNSPLPLLNFKLLRPQGQIIDVKCEKSQEIGHFDFFSAIIQLVKLSRPQGQIINLKCEKSQ